MTFLVGMFADVVLTEPFLECKAFLSNCPMSPGSPTCILFSYMFILGTRAGIIYTFLISISAVKISRYIDIVTPCHSRVA